MRSLLADPTGLNYHLRVTIFHFLIRENLITPMEPLEGIKPIKKERSPLLFVWGADLAPSVAVADRQVQADGR